MKNRPIRIGKSGLSLCSSRLLVTGVSEKYGGFWQFERMSLFGSD